MPGDKSFNISNRHESTGVTSSADLGLILRRPEIQQIAASFGSETRHYSYNSIDVIPPIPESDLKKFGNALVELVWQLDQSEPKAKVNIR